MKSPQADGSSEPLNKVVEPDSLAKKRRPKPVDAGDGHLGATEDQVSDTQAPTGEAYKDEPKQG